MTGEIQHNPFWLIIVDSERGVDINMEVLVEAFEKSVKGGSVGDVYYSITLKRYKRINLPETDSIYEPTVLRTTPPGLQETTMTDSTSKVNTVGVRAKTRPIRESDYTVQTGDTLWDIAKRRYGLGSGWTSIFQANKRSLA